MRLRAAVTVAGAVVGGAWITPASADAGPPTVPPLAFSSATLDRPARSIDVAVQSMSDVGVVVRISRNGQRLGRQEATVHPGRSVVPVRIGPRTIRRLRPGLHVVVWLFWGDPNPLRIPTTLLGLPPAAPPPAAQPS